MSRRIFLDVEEAISREVRRITFQDSRTVDKVVFKDTYDPFTGEVVSRPIEASFYDSSADVGAIHYPHFFVRLMKTREDRFTGRVTPQYGKLCISPVIYSPKAFEIITRGSDATISTIGNTVNTGILGIAKVLPGHLIRLLNGNNQGTYIVDTITKDALGNHSIDVSNTLISALPEFTFDSGTRTISFSEPVDLNTLLAADVFTDNSAATFNITSIDADAGQFVIDGVATPDVAAGGSVARTGNVLTNTDVTVVRFIIMDPAKPITAPLGQGEASSVNLAFDPEVPLDAYYLVRIDSKEKDDHTMILNRVWEEFNPPRTALPTIRRTALSAEGLLTEDVTTGGSTTIKLSVEDVGEMNIGDTVFIFDDLSPSKQANGEGFERPFESKIIGKPSTEELELADTVPDTFLVSNCTKIVSNAEYRLYMFHFVDHVTKDVEGAQYWVHEFTFWVQIWIDRQGEGKEFTTVNNVVASSEDNPEDGDTDNNFVYNDEC